MTQYTALDLCCGAGGVSRGLVDAGFRVFGIDIEPQPHYPYPFMQADALTLDPAFLATFDFVWASWMCQKWSLGSQRWDKEWPDQITPGRMLLQACGRPWIMENVIGAPLRNPVTLCGSSFGLGVIRHRLFESNYLLMAPPHRCPPNPIRSGAYCTVAGNGGDGSNAYPVWARAMGINWMTKAELRQAIPPAYSAYLGRQMLTILDNQARRAA